MLFHGSRGEGSRKQWGVGIGPGRPIFPVWFRPVPRVAMVLDTSGSMEKGDMEKVLIEGNGILRALGASMTFAVIDTKVHGMKEVSTVREAAAMLKGGGGTDFRPAFEALQALPQDKRPDLIVFGTDGCGTYPCVRPAGMNIIWLLVGSYTQQPPWGTVIKVD